MNTKTLSLYQRQSYQRKELLDRLNLIDGYALLYNVLVPEVFCMNLIRIGRIGDGGKWICNPSALLDSSDCTIYSLGLSNDPSFELDLQEYLNNKCKIRSFDKDDQNTDTMEKLAYANGIFMKALISQKTNESNNEYTFKDILNKLQDRQIDILKVDIEGAELDITDELIKIPICQLLIENHGENVIISLNLLKKLSKNGFYLFSYEINGLRPTISEYSFIHETCLKDYNVNIIFGRYLS
uniref:Methyltransferase domain-containing protein n=1 Tax=Panagrolaimus sp. ES5 TaxID=591445 RepID=A0AC34FVK6_9BILA